MKKIVLALSLSTLMAGSVMATEGSAAVDADVVGSRTVELGGSMAARTCEIKNPIASKVTFPQSWDGTFATQEYTIEIQNCSAVTGKSLAVTFSSNSLDSETKLIGNTETNHAAQNLFFKITDQEGSNVFDTGYKSTISLTSSETHLPTALQSLVYNVDIVKGEGEVTPGNIGATFTYTVRYE